MTQAKGNKIMNWIQTILLSFITALAIGCFKFLWALNNFMVGTIAKDQVQDQTIAVFRVDIDQNKRQAERNRNDITALFGLLPDNKKKQYGNQQQQPGGSSNY